MNKLILLIIFLLLFIFISQRGKENIIHYKVNNVMYRLLIADEASEWERGLMNVRKLDNADGMIFIFKDKKYRTFWNKNTYLDLVVYWISNDKIIGKIFLPSIEKTKEIITVSSPKPVDKVVELVR